MEEKLKVNIGDKWCFEGEPKGTYLMAIKHLGIKRLFERDIKGLNVLIVADHIDKHKRIKLEGYNILLPSEIHTMKRILCNSASELGVYIEVRICS